MKCQFIIQNSTGDEDLIDNYLFGRLTPTETEAFELHFLDCDECFRELHLRKQLHALIKEKGESLFAAFIEEEASRKDKNQPRPLRFPETIQALRKRKDLLLYTAGMAAVLLILIVYFVKDWNDPPLTESFRESPYLEERIKTQNSMRSGNGFRLVAPASGATFSLQTPILFRWDNPGNEPLYLKILNNEGDRLFSFPATGSELLFREELPPGVYYWKVESKDKFRIGKFFVR